MMKCIINKLFDTSPLQMRLKGIKFPLFYERGGRVYTVPYFKYLEDILGVSIYPALWYGGCFALAQGRIEVFK